MENVFEIIAISCGTVMFFGAFLGFFAYLRYLKYREVITLAEKGLMYPQHAGNGKGTLRWGIVITGLGIALCMGLYPFGWLASSGTFPLNFGPWMLIGLIPTFFGLSLLTIYFVTRKEEKANGEPMLPSSPAPVEVHPEDEE